MQRRYITVDVFTDRAFGGNPLAVVLDAGGLSTAQMQAIATEFNYSETTFVLPAADKANDAHVRIFTVRSEIPFAGHPNVGTAFVLATLAAKPLARLLFEEKAGLVPVEVLTGQGKVVGAELTSPQPLKKSSQVSAEQAASCLSLSAADVKTDRHPPLVASVGLPFLMVEVGSREALRRARRTETADRAGRRYGPAEPVVDAGVESEWRGDVGPCRRWLRANDGRDVFAGRRGVSYICRPARFSTFTPSRSSMISAIHCRWHCV
jgi:PhzF family phenazine biosynthesis protein